MSLHRPWLLVKRRTRAILSVLAIYISVSGLVTFSLFIIEESIQTTMFGTWQAIDANDWWVVKFGADRIGEANQLLKTVNGTLGWVQPISFWAYRAYGRATDVYLQGLQARIFANAPELFDGRRISASFTPRQVQLTSAGYLHTNRRVALLSPQKHPVGVSCRITGVVSVRAYRIVITEEKSTPDKTPAPSSSRECFSLPILGP